MIIFFARLYLSRFVHEKHTSDELPLAEIKEYRGSEKFMTSTNPPSSARNPMMTAISYIAITKDVIQSHMDGFPLFFELAFPSDVLYSSSVD